MRGLLLEKKSFFFCPSFQLPFSVKMAARVVVTVYFDESIDFFPTLCNLQHRFVQKSIIFVEIEQNLFTLPIRSSSGHFFYSLLETSTGCSDGWDYVRSSMLNRSKERCSSLFD